MTMPGETLEYGSDKIRTVQDDIVGLNARYESGISDINAIVHGPLANCSGEIYNEFKTMYESTVGSALEYGKQIITTYADTLGLSADELDSASKRVRGGF